VTIRQRAARDRVIHAFAERESNRIALRVRSLLGAELKSLLEESRFAGWDFGRWMRKRREH
jgi:hypothetical protein